MKKKDGGNNKVEAARVQGTIMVCLCVALIIAGVSLGVHSWFEAEKNAAQSMIEEVTNDETTEDTAELSADVQPSPDSPAVSDADEPAPVAEPVPYCNIIMVGYGNDYSEVPTPENTVRMSVDTCSELIGAMARLKELGMLSDEEVTLPDWVMDTSS